MSGNKAADFIVQSLSGNGEPDIVPDAGVPDIGGPKKGNTLFSFIRNIGKPVRKAANYKLIVDQRGNNILICCDAKLQDENNVIINAPFGAGSGDIIDIPDEENQMTLRKIIEFRHRSRRMLFMPGGNFHIHGHVQDNMHMAERKDAFLDRNYPEFDHEGLLSAPDNAVNKAGFVVDGSISFRNIRFINRTHISGVFSRRLSIIRCPGLTEIVFPEIVPSLNSIDYTHAINNEINASQIRNGHYAGRVIIKDCPDLIHIDGHTVARHVMIVNCPKLEGVIRVHPSTKVEIRDAPGVQFIHDTIPVNGT